MGKRKNIYICSVERKHLSAATFDFYASFPKVFKGCTVSPTGRGHMLCTAVTEVY